MSDQNGNSRLFRRRRAKLIRFIIAETSALGILLLAGTFVLSSRLVDSALVAAMNIVTIVAAAAVATIPIIFFAITPILPRAGR
ncbi:MAG TPA: hypothetical protein VFO30_09030 [Chthoniobacterales bacterium]|nr:hypothetical protein [Chthoniobacterales bacterium]